MDIAVIIPCYNAELYLAQAIGSVLDQGVSPKEIIIVDDGSTDSSLSIACQFEAACGGLVRVHTERSGNAAATRNIGASLATADALMFLDADDVLAPDVLESLSEGLSGQPGGIAACPWRRLDPVEGKWLSKPASCAPRRTGQDALSAWLRGWYYPPCSVLWSREAFERIGGWDEETTVNDDGDLMMRALASGIRLVETDAGTAYYRRLPAGQSSLSGKQHTYDGLAGRLAVIGKIAYILSEHGRLGSYRPSLSHAFSLIAADAAGRYPGLWHRARARARHYAPSAWHSSQRLLSGDRKAGSGTRPAAAPPRDKVEEIDFGLARAGEVLALAPPGKVPREGSSLRSQKRPAVSIIIPVYNRAYLLPRALQSVLNQTFTDYEVLIVDDCSDDDPASVVQGFKDARLRLLRQPKNQGVAAARNRGMREARAPLIALLDDDDEWFPEKLALQVEFFRQLPAEVGMVYTGVETISEDGRHTLQVPSARGDIYQELLVKNILHGAPASAMLRRNVITRVGFFDETLPAIEDYDYWLRVCRLYKVDYVTTPLVRYNDFRVSSGQAQSDERRSRNIRANLEARAQFYSKHGAEMRKAGLAHLFLLDSAERHLVPEWDDTYGALRLLAQALFLAPRSWAARHLLAKLLKVHGTRRLLGQRRRALGKILGTKGTR